ncbi:MAG: phosphoribosyl-AMP cyclohydrolase [Chloroflexi bacterium]|nr:phosphoribosyl-AMP cyclohydrolase [Chloroflexota bacterium]
MEGEQGSRGAEEQGRLGVEIQWDDQGLVPVIVQDARTGQVLMLAYMNREALEKSISTGEAHFWSRSRSELWHKGATSSNTQRIVEIRYDCDGDTLLLRVEPRGPACHTGQQSCFYRCLVKWQGPGTKDQGPGGLTSCPDP